MAGVFDFGSGMPLPPMVGPTTVYNSFSTYYNASSHSTAPNRAYHQTNENGQRQAPGGHSHTRGLSNNGYYPAQGFDHQERRDSARPAENWPCHDSDRSRSAKHRMPQLAKRMDDELLRYLQDRRVSRFFVHDIDQFLATHSELADLRPDWVRPLHTLTPLEAYRSFLKGYTKPARYLDHVFPNSLSNMKFPPVIPLIVNAYDAELIDFFDGYDYRTDLLAMIDDHVADLVHKHEHGVRLTTPQFKLVCYAVWGQPVDAYKYFEYNYQSEWLPHRYLPEHVILHGLAKPTNYEEPKPYVTPHPSEPCRIMNSYPGARLQMARACDAGVDVVEVLMEEFVSDLCRRGFRRVEIDSLRRKAEREIDFQRKIKGSADIVDLVMGLARNAQPPAPQRQLRRRVMGHRITEAMKDLKFVLAQVYSDKGLGVGMRRRAERELVLAVVAQATRDHAMTCQQGVELLSLVPVGKKARKRRERRNGVPNILRVLSRWL